MHRGSMNLKPCGRVALDRTPKEKERRNVEQASTPYLVCEIVDVRDMVVVLCYALAVELARGKQNSHRRQCGGRRQEYGGRSIQCVSIRF